MKYLKAFLTGIFFPTVVIPFMLVVLVTYGHRVVLDNVFPHLIAVLWGVWNIFYVAKLRAYLPGSEMLKSLISGAVFGLLIAFVGVFWIDLPAQLGVVGSYRFLPFIAVPVLYALVWAFVVSPLNRAVGIEDA